MSESEEIIQINSNDKKSKQHKGMHINYEAAARSYLNKINAHVKGFGLEPKFESLEAFKDKHHVKDEIAYQRFKRAYKYFHDNVEPERGNPPDLSTYAIMPSIPPKSESSIIHPPNASASFSVPMNQKFSSNQMKGKNSNALEIEGQNLFGKYYRERS